MERRLGRGQLFLHRVEIPGRDRPDPRGHLLQRRTKALRVDPFPRRLGLFEEEPSEALEPRRDIRNVRGGTLDAPGLEAPPLEGPLLLDRSTAVAERVDLPGCLPLAPLLERLADRPQDRPDRDPVLSPFLDQVPVLRREEERGSALGDEELFDRRGVVDPVGLRELLPAQKLSTSPDSTTSSPVAVVTRRNPSAVTPA